MLEVKKVSKLYTNRRGVDEIDFSMNRGEIVGFLGPNGAGKTTTMRMITGYLNPTHGSILVDGVSMADQPKQVRRKIGYLPETPPLYLDMRVRDYLKFVADLRDIPARSQKKRIGEVTEMLGLTGRERQVIRGLSKGYKQRLGLAQAILHEPDLLVLDEPTSGLDPKQIIEIRKLIRELGEKHTVLLSTHILPEVNSICNRVLIINQGKIVTDGKPDELAGSLAERFEVNLEVRGSKDELLTAISAIPEVAEVTAISSKPAAELLIPTQEPEEGEHALAVPDGGASTVRLKVVSADQTDVREALFFRLASLGTPILEMNKVSLSLEDVFLKLTTDEQMEEGAGSVNADQDPTDSERVGALAEGPRFGEEAAVERSGSPDQEEPSSSADADAPKGEDEHA
ncbi:ABC transporter ATP-binding protein [Gorillibacterium timonense]|uniref:ABC transporter ATP-binding protein n=1 Tax=Gorillibacterium timonense TaxID=1689269 RepID=UPI00071C516B|nr:ATP-binding cassette domain-containing protein [Gorillibacterium timonense]